MMQNVVLSCPRFTIRLLFARTVSICANFFQLSSSHSSFVELLLLLSASKILFNMGSRGYPLHDSGIYHNLPTFSPDIKGLTAIVTGANGISGFGTLRILLGSPERWTKIYALSRRPPPRDMMDLLPADQKSRVEHVACDFLSKPEDIAQAMKGKIDKVDVVFFYSYLQPKPEPGKGAWSNAQELCDVNSALLDNFLKALPIANLEPKRVLLQTGAKNYGVHLGRARAPYVESDPRVTLEPNFYYPQEVYLPNIT